MSDLENLIKNLKVFEKMYNEMRIVDPMNKKVLDYVENEIQEADMPCYDFWKRQEICDNCISMRAYVEDDIFVKIENKLDRVYMVTAVPIMMNHRKVIAELLKNITHSLYMEEGQRSMETVVYSLINGINHAAVRDSLTEIYNFRYINERLPVEMINVSIYHKPLSIILVDIDHFRTVNNRYGYPTGDSILKEMVGLLDGFLHKEKDWIARYGDDQFLLCLPGVSHDEAEELSEKISKTLACKEFTFEDNAVKITASFGASTMNIDTDFFDLEDLIKSAEEKLRLAKNESGKRAL